MYDTIEIAIETAREAQQAILSIEATPQNRKSLDASYNALRDAIQQLTKLIEPVGN
jgi:hypothetical protein